MINYKYKLKYSGRKAEIMQAMEKELQSFYLWRDSEAQLVDKKTYLAMVDKGEIASPKSYWQVREGNLGIVCLTSYCKYTTTWEHIGNYIEAFTCGYIAGKQAGIQTGIQLHKQLCADEKEAYKEQRKRNKAYKQWLASKASN